MSQVSQSEQSSASVNPMDKLIDKLPGPLSSWARKIPQPMMEFISFGFVGLSGMVVDALITYICREFFGIFVKYSMLIAFPVAVTWNYELNRRWTFYQSANEGTEEQSRFIFRSYVIFVLSCTLGLLVRYLTMEVLERWGGMDDKTFLSIGSWTSTHVRLSYISYVLGIVIGYVVNFVGSKYFAFVRKGRTTDTDGEQDARHFE